MISNVCFSVKSECLIVNKGRVVFSGPPREYLEYYVFPVLLPGMAELLHRAQEEKCFEVRFQFKSLAGNHRVLFHGLYLVVFFWFFARKPQ